MAPSLTDQTSCPPEYTSQRGDSETSPIQSFESRSNASNDDLVSAQSQLITTPSVDDTTPRLSDVHFQEAMAPHHDRGSTPRRRYCSLPYSNSSATFPLHLRYNHVSGTSISTSGLSEFVNDTPISPLQQKLTSHSTIKLNPTNYVFVSRKSTPQRRLLSLYRSSASIKGNYTVNPYLHVPAALLSPASPHARDDQGRTRKNLRFEVENGGIDVNIFLIGEPPSDDPATTSLRTSLDLKIRGNEATRFPLIAKIHTPKSPRPPFHLSVTGINGYHALHLPPTFHGLVTINVVAGNLDTHMSLSQGFIERSMILSETAAARSYFLGELGGWARDKQGWEGDRIDVSVSRGMVRLQLLEERDGDMLRRLRWKIGL